MERQKGLYERFFKRPFDICCALAALIVFSWLYVLVAVLVRIKLGKPIFFKQKRPGLNEKIFELYKFRTMTDARDNNGKLLPDEIRLTSFGKFLRSTSLDEIPEAFNILKGDMSVVGPRPLLVKYLPYYSQEQRIRHKVRPGLTGLAQVNGRNALSWDEKFKLDVDYTEKVSFITDVLIVLKTILSVVKREGISAQNEATMGSLIDYVEKKSRQSLLR